MTDRNVSSTVVAVFSESPISVVQTQDGSFTLAGKQEFLDKLTSARAFVESYVFETDDDRKSARSAKAEMNKLEKQIKAELKKAEADLFAPVREDVAEINSAVGELVSLLSDQINFFDNKYKEEKQESIVEIFESARLSAPAHLRDKVELPHIMDSKWLNRTTTMSKIAEAIDDRLQAIEVISEMTDGLVDEAIVTLQSTAWNSTRAVTKITKQKAEAEEKAQRLAEEKALSELHSSDAIDEAIETRTAHVTVPVSQLTKFRRVMNANGWEFEYAS